MQLPNSDEPAPVNPQTPPDPPKPSDSNSAVVDDDDDDDGTPPADEDSSSAALDVSGKSLDFSIGESSSGDGDGVGALYLYKNVYNLLPRSVGRLKRLRTLKFFGNEINLFSSSEFGNLVGLECLQLRLSSPAFDGLPLHKFRGLKELELSKVPSRSKAIPILSEIARLNCLTKLSVCYFSIRYLPPEIGCLSNLEYLDLSFNKMKSLPAEISNLTALVSLKIANNKLSDLPMALSSLKMLENLDLSHNRLTSLGSLDLRLMRTLQNLNLQHNKLPMYFQIPSWICCNLEGNGKDMSNDDFSSTSVEMDVYETTIQKNDENHFHTGFHDSSLSIAAPSSNSRCFTTRRSAGRWKRQFLQRRARQERLNNSRKSKGVDHPKLHMKDDEALKSGIIDAAFESYRESALDIINFDDDDDDKSLLTGEDEGVNVSHAAHHDMCSKKEELCERSCSCLTLDSTLVDNGEKKDCYESDASSCNQDVTGEHDDVSYSGKSKSSSKFKRPRDGDLDNKILQDPKRWKCGDCSSSLSCRNMSCKYSNMSFCGAEDHIPDGFYDAGRDRPFMPLESYEQIFHLDSREVILVDRLRDKELDGILFSARDMVSRLKQLNGLNTDRDRDDELQVALYLALFVSDHFGGTDKAALIERRRRAGGGSISRKPFVCTCSVRNSESVSLNPKQSLETVEDIAFSDICEKSLRFTKAKHKSVVVPIGTLQFGVCRHRALLLKYLCDRMDPPVPCELVRGYLDFMPHAWNVILVKKKDSTKRDDSRIRMVVDACRPHDVREETDPEYYCRYIPLSRSKVSSPGSIPADVCSFPVSSSDKTQTGSGNSLIRCKYGSADAAAKMRTLEVYGTSVDDIRDFEYSCLGEVRILGALRHPCIVEMYGHSISSKWTPMDGSYGQRILQSVIYMEYIKGGSLKGYIEKLSKAGEKHVPVELALSIARNVACALVELHSKHIIHRDIKSANILIDIDRKTADGTPVVKLCDFDRAVPLSSYLHTCCIAHIGIPPPDVCVGTPRWMAPEVLRAMHKQNIYGLEVDIWSFGCLLYEMLTLQIPYLGLSEAEIHDCISIGKRPKLTDELEAFQPLKNPARAQSAEETDQTDTDLDGLRFLVDLFSQCTVDNPESRPTADSLYKSLLERSTKLTSSRS
ncbi:uncharacterized protein LOC126789986 [Argentina anserina]|uniref:uncharacterized protein LOC126789986 n=1 Tax=Argentina anserina TaxID=57926 RepID=UPI002176616C|nr:uncharacterized protein LOC126789986 [Potentilla anserina]